MNLPPVKSLKPWQVKDNTNFNTVQRIFQAFTYHSGAALLLYAVAGMRIISGFMLMPRFVTPWGLPAAKQGQRKRTAFKRLYSRRNGVIYPIHLHFKTL